MCLKSTPRDSCLENHYYRAECVLAACTSCNNAFAQGTTIIRQKQMQVVKHQIDGTPVERLVMTPLMLHEDIISDSFWEQHGDLLQ